MADLKVMTILGTRPELIRLAEIIKKLDAFTNHIFVHTNQNFNYELNEIFFEEFGLRKPDYLLEVKSDSIGEQIGKIISQTEIVMRKEKPDALLILGDTNSALSCIVAKRMKIPVFHMEAGNRCFDDRVPEEINRRIVDHTSDINMPYTEHARRNLLREGIDSHTIFVVGSPLREVIEKNMSKIENSRVLEELGLQTEKYFLVSFHREENVDSERNLQILINTLEALADKYNYPIIISTHPRTKMRLENLNISENKLFNFHKPFGMFDFVKLQKNAYCVLSDSGTIHEEAAIFSIPALVIRESTERPEVFDTGNVILTGINTDVILQSIEVARKQYEENVSFATPEAYQDTNVSDRVLKLIIGMSKLVQKKKYYLLDD
ncbi:non-hydrolyzing UDP-N-acetylglucosamine 2-epimerase [Methanosarcina sp. WH1]|uniref:non-hydrolyzing UDP-N-acetylglucosamine 2-epimerase n=1 Tax=Methanosarcina sp. WH1 TaxID=1434102 RepID=UPI00061584F7|nr:UDP-N-acetylglucosamine 2-epimerase (non-hydrolyzing) [Methanosarcina sp. WH1]AKB23283.1 UDP-N-acetylglucosamine 2-epimerase [Methanosarcina sp. WH1]